MSAGDHSGCEWHTHSVFSYCPNGVGLREYLFSRSPNGMPCHHIESAPMPEGLRELIKTTKETP